MMSPFVPKYNSTGFSAVGLKRLAKLLVNADSRTVAEKLQASCGNR
jgi:hypothetical protein